MKNITQVYLIRHSNQLKIRNCISKESSQISNEKIVLSVEGEINAQKLSNLEELKNILLEFIDLDYKSKNGMIDINVGLESVLCRYCS